LIIEEQVRVTALEQIANSQGNFDVIERLEEKIGSAGLERAAFGFFIGIGGQNDYGQKTFL